MSSALLFLLNHQYVTCNAFPNRCWAVKRGSGMGLCHSGEVAGDALLVRAELVLAAMMERHSITSFFRSKDDFIFTGSTASGRREFIQEYK
eukprot:9792477-Karenia_brevis.AAC.1